MSFRKLSDQGRRNDSIDSYPPRPDPNLNVGQTNNPEIIRSLSKNWRTPRLHSFAATRCLSRLNDELRIVRPHLFAAGVEDGHKVLVTPLRSVLRNMRADSLALSVAVSTFFERRIPAEMNGEEPLAIADPFDRFPAPYESNTFIVFEIAVGCHFNCNAGHVSSSVWARRSAYGQTHRFRVHSFAQNLSTTMTGPDYR